MTKERMNALTDGVIAIILTIMVLELNTPETYDLAGILSILQQIGIYLLSFIYVAIYWNNHHHLLYVTKTIKGSTLWWNFSFLFISSLIPFATRLIHESGYSSFSGVFYGVVLLLCAISFSLLFINLKRIEDNEDLRLALRANAKELISIFIYVIGICVCFFAPIIGILIYVIPALIWLVPEKRVEKIINQKL